MTQHIEYGTEVSDLIKKNVLLPDFQRDFEWEKDNKIAPFIASVFLAMPLGSVLELESEDPGAFACKVIGTNERDTKTNPSANTKFLIDGQQRVTVLSAVFSNALFKIVDETENLKAEKDLEPALQRRYYLRIPKFSAIRAGEEDVFGLGSLCFSKTTTEQGENYRYLDECTPESIKNLVKYAGTDKIPIHPDSNFDDRCTVKNQELWENYKQTIRSFSTGESTDNDSDYYCIPLFLLGEQLIEAAPGKKCYQSLYNNLFESEIAADLKNQFGSALSEQDPGCTKEDVAAVLSGITGSSYCWETDSALCAAFNKESHFTDDVKMALTKMINDLIDAWAGELRDYLRNSLANMRLSCTKVMNAQRSRAIQIFCAINVNASNLSDFDLMIAMAAGSEDPIARNFRWQIKDAIGQFPVEKDDVYYEALPGESYQPGLDEMFSQCKTGWEGCFGFLNGKEIAKTYQEAYLRLLCFANEVENVSIAVKEFKDADGGYLPKHYFSADSYSALGADFLTAEQPSICRYLNLAAFFLQTRCGVKSVGELVYSQQLTLIACVLLYIEKRNPEEKQGPLIKKGFRLLEAWRWISLFSGDWDKDQNTLFRIDITEILSTVETWMEGKEAKREWLFARKEKVFTEPGFSDVNYLTRGGPFSEVEKEGPKKGMRSAICQFVISRGLPRICKVKPGESEYIYACCDTKNQAHHLLPVASVRHVEDQTIPYEKETKLEGNKYPDELRNKAGHRINSPCNFTFVAASDNQEIGNQNVYEYCMAYKDVAQSYLIPKVSWEELGSVEGQNRFLRDRFDLIDTDVEKRLTQLLTNSK